MLRNLTFTYEDEVLKNEQAGHKGLPAQIIRRLEMDIILFAVIACCITSIVFSITRKYFIASLLLTHFATTIVFVLSFIDSLSKGNLVISILTGVFNFQVLNYILLFIAWIFCYFSYAIILSKKKLNWSLGTAFYIIILYFPMKLYHYPSFLIVILLTSFLIPCIFSIVKK